MILCLDVGNHHIFGGAFIGDQLQFQFRYNSRQGASSDEIGVFLRNVLRENSLDPDAIEHIALCSVVPHLVHSIRSACVKYFSKSPFILRSGVKTGLKIRCHNPQEIGSDRIGNAVAAAHHFPGKDLIIIDLGTATTMCAVSQDKAYLGGTILAGVKISLEVLQAKTAQLPMVEIVKPRHAVGQNTEENLQSGAYYGTIGAIKELTKRFEDEVFQGRRATVIGTGGFARFLGEENIYHHFVPDLILQGLYLAFMLNRPHAHALSALA
jgi:type III pantothenate kinase